MIQFNGNQSQAQVTTAIEAGGFTLVSFAVVGADTQYGAASVTVVLLDGNDTDGDPAINSYRTGQFSSITAAKTYVAGLVSTYNLGSKFNTATVDDGNGVMYTLAEVEAW